LTSLPRQSLRRSDNGKPVLPAAGLTRRSLVGWLAATITLPGLASCGSGTGWNEVNITGYLPRLAFSMRRARDGREVTALDYRGDVVMLFFGYTACSAVCPLTLTYLAQILDRIGTQRDRVRVLFVTVDPERDGLSALKTYAAAFAPEVDGLRGDADQLALLARRYRVAYALNPETPVHGSAVYVFDTRGDIRLLLASLASASPNIDGAADDLRRLIENPSSPGWISQIVG